MQERIIEIIVYLLEEFKQEPDSSVRTDLSKQLLAQGYTENEINLAFSWIFNHLQKSTPEQKEEFSYREDSIRVLHDLEKLVISPDAFGYLLQLWQLGMIKEYDMEDVIEKALSIGSTHITLDDIKSFAATVIFNSERTPEMESLFYHQGTNTIQ